MDSKPSAPEEAQKESPTATAPRPSRKRVPSQYGGEDYTSSELIRLDGDGVESVLRPTGMKARAKSHCIHFPQKRDTTEFRVRETCKHCLIRIKYCDRCGNWLGANQFSRHQRGYCHGRPGLFPASDPTMGSIHSLGQTGEQRQAGWRREKECDRFFFSHRLLSS